MFLNGWTGDVPEKTNQGDALGNNTAFYLEDFSSRPLKDLGQKHQDLDVAAPGAWVVGPYKSAFANNTGYYYLSGTSMSAPHVSAISAMLLQQNPDLKSMQAALTKRVLDMLKKLAGEAVEEAVFGQPGEAVADLGRVSVEAGGHCGASRVLRPGIGITAGWLGGRVLDRDGHRCRAAACGATRFLEVHHRIPRSRGGSNRPDNLITLCSACHQATHDHEPGAHPLRH